MKQPRFFFSFPTLLIVVLLFGVLPAHAAEREGNRHPIWNAPEPIYSRVRIQYMPHLPGTPLVLRLDIDEKPFTFLTFSEYLANANLYVLTPDLIALEGCGSSIDSCDRIWRVLRLSKKSLVPIALAGFEKDISRPVFAKSFMGYQGRLTTGKLGCLVFDWRTEQYLARWSPDNADDDAKPGYGISVHFSPDTTTVTCRQVVGTKSNPNYAGGDEPRELPILGKEYTVRLSDGAGNR